MAQQGNTTGVQGRTGPEQDILNLPGVESILLWPTGIATAVASQWMRQPNTCNPIPNANIVEILDLASVAAPAIPAPSTFTRINLPPPASQVQAQQIAQLQSIQDYLLGSP